MRQSRGRDKPEGARPAAAYQLTHLRIRLRFAVQTYCRGTSETQDLQACAVCHICGKHPTVKSHHIPRAFTKGIRGQDKNVLLTDRDRAGHRVTQGGTFSDNIFCAEHEAVTGQLDDIAVRFCKAAYSGPPMRAGGFFEVTGFNPNALIRFACSILLRCHYSDRDETRLVNLGPYAAVLADVVFGNNSSDSVHVYVYSAVSAEISFRELASIPASMRVGHTRRWSFQCGGIAFVVDLGRPKPAYPASVLRSEAPIRGPVFDFERTTLSASWRSLIGQRRG